jgi:phosphoglycolate phosphatase-like HAD superfamily hydrolase
VILILDLDGVCGDYLPHLFEFLRRRVDYLRCGPDSVEEITRVWESAGISEAEYRALKEEYREEFKWRMPPVKGMPGVTAAALRAGHRVVIASTRKPDSAGRTEEWLDRNGFDYHDCLCVGPGSVGKYWRVHEALRGQIGDSEVMVVEDTFGSLLSAGKIGWDLVLRNASHNRETDYLGTRAAAVKRYGIRRYNTSAELMDIVLEKGI